MKRRDVLLAALALLVVWQVAAMIVNLGGALGTRGEAGADDAADTDETPAPAPDGRDA